LTLNNGLIKRPTILYKYRADNSYTEDIFKKRKVWLSRLSNLNDPMEGRIADISTVQRKEVREETMKHQIAGFIWAAKEDIKTGTHFCGKTSEETKKILRKLSKKNDLDLAYAFINRFFEERNLPKFTNPNSRIDSISTVLEKTGIFSLSEVKDSMLMWSHYSGGHSGLCIGFDVSDKSKLGSLEYCKPINYRSMTPELDFKRGVTELQISLSASGLPTKENTVSLSDPGIQNIIFTKSEEWKYEKEWRCISANDGEHPWPGKIVEVIFGMKCPDSRKFILKRKIEEFVGNDIRFAEVRASKSGFKLDVADYSG
jgi:hypothetical protein